jgi:hypothetical protein
MAFPVMASAAESVALAPATTNAKAAAVSANPQAPVSYNFQIRPILAGACFKCHGPDEKTREAKLRLDTQEGAWAKAIKPGNPAESELIKRLDVTDPEEIMPPPETHLTLKPEEKALLRQWVLEGATYDKHWSFKPLAKPPVPELTKDAAWVRQEIDKFVLERLQRAGINPAEPASKERWLKRVTMDLTGLPPNLEEMDAFLADTSAEAETKVVDRLLASPEYGERMALDWLDAARYADTFGRHEDSDSENFPYRDWAIRMFNQNLPFDQFVEWQIAGDMMPQATVDQKLATTFNRLHPQSNESGSDEEEFRLEHVADRVKTTAAAFLGLTMDCAKCHDHKYDPISTKEYYSFSAFLNNIDEQGLYSRFTNSVPTPSMFLYEGDEEAQHQALLQKIAATTQELNAAKRAAEIPYALWLAAGNEGTLPKPTDHIAFEGKLKAGTMENIAKPDRPGEYKFKPETADGPVGKALFLKGDTKLSWEGAGDFKRSDAFSIGLWVRPGEKQKKAVIFHRTVGSVDAANRGYELVLNEMRPDFIIAHFMPGNGIRILAEEPIAVGEWSHLLAVYDGSSKAAGMSLYVNGKPIKASIMADHLTKDLRYEFENGDLDPRKVADAGLSSQVALEFAGRRNDAGLVNAHMDELKVFDRALTAPEAMLLTGGSPTKADWFPWYVREKDEACRAISARIQALRDEENQFTKKVREVMVMRESTGERRKTYVLQSGAFNKKGAEVSPDSPASVLPWPTELPRNRLGFAKWFTHRDNPLTARVAVNRYWQLFFGKGLVATPEDFGIQGALPSHPELLDWLATDFREHGWDVKRLCKMIALSATYRQSGKPRDANLLESDPQNRLLARGPRHRWNAELIRDQALAVSGLLVRQLGGPSVFPYQPVGLWEDSGTQHVYKQDKGPKLYRRSMYSFWRRTLPPPTMTVFDAPTREYCVVRRESTSTPMQALALLNDPQMLEASRVLAESLIKRHPQDAAARLSEGFRRWTGRKISPPELDALQKLYTDFIQRYQHDPAAASDLLTKNGEAPTDASLPAWDVAALTMVQRTLLNSPETVLKY